MWTIHVNIRSPDRLTLFASEIRPTLGFAQRVTSYRYWPKPSSPRSYLLWIYIVRVTPSHYDLLPCLGRRSPRLYTTGRIHAYSMLRKADMFPCSPNHIVCSLLWKLTLYPLCIYVCSASRIPHELHSLPSKNCTSSRCSFHIFRWGQNSLLKVPLSSRSWFPPRDTSWGPDFRLKTPIASRDPDFLPESPSPLMFSLPSQRCLWLRSPFRSGATSRPQDLNTSLKRPCPRGHVLSARHLFPLRSCFPSRARS